MNENSWIEREARASRMIFCGANEKNVRKNGSRESRSVSEVVITPFHKSPFIKDCEDLRYRAEIQDTPRRPTSGVLIKKVSAQFRVNLPKLPRDP